MQLVITVDLEKTEQPLAEVFRLIGDCRLSDDVREKAAGEAGLVKDSGSHVIGDWAIEQSDERPHPLESSYRAAAIARYARTKQVEVDRFATVSLTEDGAFVQGWLFVPRTEALAARPEVSTAPKPPQSVKLFRDSKSKAC